MIRAAGTGPNGRRFLILGLEAGNLQRLLDGDPIRLDGRDYGVDVEIVIDYAPTKEAMIERLREAGVVLPPEKEWKR